MLRSNDVRSMLNDRPCVTDTTATIGGTDTALEVAVSAVEAGPLDTPEVMEESEATTFTRTVMV